MQIRVNAAQLRQEMERVTELLRQMNGKTIKASKFFPELNAGAPLGKAVVWELLGAGVIKLTDDYRIRVSWDEKLAPLEPILVEEEVTDNGS